MKSKVLHNHHERERKLSYNSLEEELASLKEENTNLVEVFFKKKKQKEDILLRRELITLAALTILFAFFIYTSQ